MTDSEQTFDNLVETYYHAWLRFHPETAVEVGVDTHADRLTPHDDDDLGALQVLNEKVLAGLEEISQEALDADRAIDYRLLYGGALLEHHELLEHDWRRRDPARYLPINAIYQLMVRPVTDLAAALQGRLSAIPAHLRGARSHLGSLPELIPAVWLESAVTEARGGIDYLRSLVRHPKIKQAFESEGEIRPLVEEAVRALEDFIHFLEEDLAPKAQGEFACGREHFDRILRHRHFLDLDADQLHAFGERLLSETLQELKAVTQELRGDEDVAALTETLKQDHPAADELLGVYRERMEAARAFVVEKDLVTMPGEEMLKVVETPGFLRHQIPFAAYLDPVPNDASQCGHYYVTPAHAPDLLAEHYRASIDHTCVHEAWPGHHLQFVTANGSAVSRTLPRLLNPSATLFEGWALYCEQMMQEQGFMGLPEQRFILLRDRLWRALRIVLDVELHTRGLTLDAAATRMSEVLGFPREQAMADLTWYSRAPGVPMGYATGWALITATRGQLSSQSEFSLKDFHDQLLASGSVALPLVLERQFGSDVWQVSKGLVFGAS